MTDHPNARSSAADSASGEDPAGERAAGILAIASHEIRTPLGAMLTTAEALLASGLDPQQIKYATILRDAAENLLGLANSLLDATAAPAAGPEAFRPAALVRSVADLFAPHAARAGLTLELDCGTGSDATVSGPAAPLRQIVTNLVDNAVKYTASGGVRVSVAIEEGTELVLRVADSGPGIEQADRQRVFGAYQRLGSNPEGIIGHGLGLWAAQRAAQRHGGALEVEQSSAAGTVFRLTLPVTPAIAAERPDGVAAADDADLVDGTAYRVLVVDDNPAALALAEVILTAFGWTAVTARSARRALDLLGTGETRFDCILSDLTMPHMSGTDFVAALADLGAAGAIPVIACSAARPDPGKPGAGAPGFSGFVAKPYRPAELHRAVREAVGGWRGRAPGTA